MSRSNNDKPFYIDIGTSIVAIRCASNHDVIVQYDYGWHPSTLNLAKEICDRMNKEAEAFKPLRNCDVGSVEEQVERFSKFCLCRKCSDCQFHVAGDFFECGVRWSQMPYKKEEAE